MNDLRQTLTPAGWKDLVRLHGASKTDELADWVAAHAGLPMRYRAEHGERCLVVRAITITGDTVHIECQEITASARPTVDSDGWEIRHYDLQGPPPIWVQKPIAIQPREGRS